MVGRRLVVCVAVMAITAGFLGSPAEAAVIPFEVDCTDPVVGYEITNPGTYVLKFAVKDCLVPVAIKVSASNVTVDLRGRAVDGNDVGGSIGVLAVIDKTNVTIRNGAVSDFATGVELASTKSVVTGIIARSNSTGINGSEPNNTFSRNVVANNGTGLNVDDRSTVSRNIATDNTGSGIGGDDKNEVTGNDASGNGVSGISFGDQNVISGNTANGNVDDGIEAGDANRISGNRTAGNRDSGIEFYGLNTIVENVVTGNAYGIYAYDGGNRVLRNRSLGNGTDGIRVTGADNKVKENQANGNLDSGILFASATTGNTAVGNVVKGNAESGIDVEGTNPSGGMTNIAQDNGDVPQCDAPGLCDVRPPSAGFDLDCSGPVGHVIADPGTHRLRTAVDGCGSTKAIEITSPGVVLDLQGRGIRGAGTGDGVYISGVDDVTVRNGSLSQFDSGVVDNGVSTVTRMVVRSMDFNGISSSGSISENVITYAAIKGIFAFEDASITKNHVVKSVGDGIHAIDDGVVISGNSALANGRGIVVDLALTVRVSANTAVGNDGFGILAGHGDVISRNKVVANGDVGISAGNGNRVSQNSVKGNRFDGIAVGDENRVSENVASGNGGDGIWVNQANVIVENTAHGNLSQNGIRVIEPGPLTKLAYNVANGNTFLGINAQSGPVSGGKTNRAKDNVQPEQCRPEGICT